MKKELFFIITASETATYLNISRLYMLLFDKYSLPTPKSSIESHYLNPQVLPWLWSLALSTRWELEYASFKTKSLRDNNSSTGLFWSFWSSVWDECVPGICCNSSPGPRMWHIEHNNTFSSLSADLMWAWDQVAVVPPYSFGGCLSWCIIRTMASYCSQLLWRLTEEAFGDYEVQTGLADSFFPV